MEHEKMHETARKILPCLNVKQVAARLGVSEKTIRREIDLGNLRVGRVGNRIIITEEALADFVAACEGVNS